MNSAYSIIESLKAEGAIENIGALMDETEGDNGETNDQSRIGE